MRCQSPAEPFTQVNYGGLPDGPTSKVHISATADEAKGTLRLVDTIAREMGMTYKFLSDTRQLADGGALAAGQAQQGKFITAYPTPEAAREFVSRVDGALRAAGIGGGAAVSPNEKRWAPDSPITHRWVPDVTQDGDRYATDGGYGEGREDYIARGG